MSIKNTFQKYFNSHSETGENHWDPKLKTHYFKTTKERAFPIIENIFRQSSSFEIVAVSAEHGEISANYKAGRKAFVVATIIMVKPFRTAVDFSVTTDSGLPDFGYSHNLIPKLYDLLEKEMDLVEK